VTPLRVLVCGNRDLKSDGWQACIRAWLQAVDDGAKRRGVPVMMAHGDCGNEDDAGHAIGADWIAARIALGLGWTVVPYPADWAKHGRSAGPRRNREMFALHKPHRGLAFGRLYKHRSDEETGTGDMVKVMNQGACLVTVVPAANVLP
jgi:hypothetical protein